MSNHHVPPVQKTKRWPWVLGIIGALIVGIMMGSASAQPTPVAQSAAPLQSTAPEPEVKTEPTGPKTSFEDGTWVVGEDIQPGTYKTTGAREGVFEYCQITTHSDTEADSGKTLDWKNGNANEPIRVKIDGKVKSVKATGCEPFEKV